MIGLGAEITPQQAIEFFQNTLMEYHENLTSINSSTGFSEKIEMCRLSYEAAIIAIEKQIPKKPTGTGLIRYCPSCFKKGILNSCCQHCGQRLELD